jgi:hypothetical protein
MKQNCIQETDSEELTKIVVNKAMEKQLFE